MRLQRGVKGFLLGLAMVWLSVASAIASPYHGQVTFNGLPLPGSVVTVTATQGDKKLVAVSDDQGLFGFADLADGVWHLDIEMTGFAPLETDITVPTVVTATDIPADAAAAAAIAAMPAAQGTGNREQGTAGTAAGAQGTGNREQGTASTAAAAPRIAVVVFEMKLLTLDAMRAAANPVKVAAGSTAQGTGNREQGTASAAAAGTNSAAAANGATGAAGAASAAAGAKGTAAAKGGAKGGAKTTATAAGGAAGGGGAAASEAGGGMASASQDTTSAQANDGFLINGSVSNAATSQFSLNQAFGNNRNGGRWLYTGGVNLVLSDSALNAKNFSLNGEDSAKPPFFNIVAGAQLLGPLKIPHLLSAARAPFFQFGYQRTENKNDTINPVRMPTEAQQLGDLTGAGAVYDPNTGNLFGATNCLPALFAVDASPTACIPQNEINSQAGSVAQALLKYYPLPNSPGGSEYNYQVPLAGDTHTDYYQFRLQKQLGSKNNVNGSLTVGDSRSSNPSIFGFLDTGNYLNTAVNASWYHRFTQRLSMNASYNFSRSRNVSTSYFSDKTNVEGNAGITGNDTSATYWGPPGLGFASGIAGLSDGPTSSSRPETNSVTYFMTWNRFRHNMTFGGDFRRQEFNYLTESNPRGSLYFSGAQTASSTVPGSGNDFADFLLGLPDTSSIAYGNADKYLRQSAYDLYVDDDFRVNPELSIRAGLRWEYGAPMTEIKNRLVNLDVLPGFTNETPVLASSPKGALTGQTYPTSLMRPDYSFPDPKIGIAWRPISGSSLLIKAGYGIYNDTSVYRATTYAMAQQAPLSTSLSVANSAACRFTITAPFQQLPCATTTPDTFAVDPNFKVGYAQQWRLDVQRDLPFSLQLVATYLGTKGTHGVQEILPNSYGLGLTASPYGSAPVGYFYRDSLGDSTREEGQISLRRRLRNGFTASMLYKYSKSLDDDYSLGGQGSVTTSGGSPQVAQDWTNPAGQRGLSTFDQRNALTASLQYTTGMGLGGHTLLSGWRGAAYKEWTVLVNINEASGTPETPIDPVVVPGTSSSGVIRANYTGAAIHGSYGNGVFLNPAAFVAPTTGFGNARRDSITGPSQFGLGGSIARTFRLHDRFNLDARADVQNALNHVAYSGWNTTVGQPLFGTAAGAGGMRSMSVTLRMRF